MSTSPGDFAVSESLPIPTTNADDHGGPLVNVAQYANGNGSMGLTGWWKLAGNLTAMALVAGSFLYLQFTLITQNRADRQEDRIMFKEELKSLRDQQDRHIGEVKSAMDTNTAATRDLTSEIRHWRGVVGPNKEPKP